MAYDAKVLEVMIASPGDVTAERDAVRDALNEWNALNARAQHVVLMDLGWDTHSSPDLGGRPQQLINDRVLKHADLLIGIFWTRLGSPTGKADSGSVEEIQEHIGQGKPAMLYFSDAPVAPDSIDPAQYAKVKEFRAWAQQRGIVHSFTNTEQFRNVLMRHITTTLRDNPYTSDLLARPAPPAASGFASDGGSTSLSPEALDLLTASVNGAGKITRFATVGGVHFGVGRRQFGDLSPRSQAVWERALDELLRENFIRDGSGKRELFSVTDSGYKFIDAEKP